MTIYLIDGLHISGTKVKIGFAVVCVSSPTCGALMSNYLIKRCIGDNKRKTIPFLIVVALLAGACAVPIPFLDNFYSLIVALWGYLFFGGILVPVMTFCIMNSLERKHKA